jgi:ADP-heptose:LPS heptosyltransferase
MVFDLYFRLFRRADAVPVSDNERILFLMFTRGIGDALLCTPALNGIKKRYPDAEVTVIASPYVGELVKRFRAVDRFVPFPVEHARLSDVYRTVRRLRRFRFDTGIDVLADRSWLSALVSFLSGARRLVGFSAGLRSILLNQRTRVGAERRHFAESILSMVVKHELASDESISFESRLKREKDTEYANSVIDGRSRPIFCVHPGSKGAREFRWAPGKWVSLLDSIRNEYGGTVLLIGGKDEEKLCRFIERHLGEGSANLAGKCSLGETAALIEESDMLLSIASGPLHMAVALDVPAVYIGGGVDLVRWGAYGGSARHSVVLLDQSCKPEECGSCYKRTGLCSDSITVNEFFRSVREMVEKLGLAGRMMP